MILFSTIWRALVKKFPDILITSMCLIAGLAWNDAFTTIINHYFPTDKTAKSYIFKFIYAILLTMLFLLFIAILITFSTLLTGDEYKI